jgi:hypothetical protein
MKAPSSTEVLILKPRLQRWIEPSPLSNHSCDLLPVRIAVQLADETAPIFFGILGQMLAEDLNLLARSFPKFLHTAIVGCIELDQASVELMFADEQINLVS